MNNALEKILEKYFDYNDKVKYYTPTDAIAKNNYIRWSYCQREHNRIIISLGSDEGEVEVKTFADAEKLEQFIKLILY